jgi:sugar phosphate isomerase/epimerase
LPVYSISKIEENLRMQSEKNQSTRRQFLRAASAGLTGAIMFPHSGNLNAKTYQSGQEKSVLEEKIKLGIASYTFRKFSLEDTIKMTQQLGIKRIALKSHHLPLESTKREIKNAATMVRNEGIALYGAGVIYMKDATEVDRAFDYAKTAEIDVIIGVPEHHLLERVEKKVKEYDIKVAIHNHGPGDQRYPTLKSAYDRIKEMDNRMGLCVDVGHIKRYGNDPVHEIESYGDRVLDVHIKDVDNASEEGKTVEIGRGIINIPKILEKLLKINYSGTVAFEYEKDEQHPLPGLAESVGYVRGILDMI